MSKKMEYNACSPSRVNHFISALQNFEKQALTRTSFRPLLELANVRTCCSLIYALIEKYDFENEWFVIGGKHIRFHLYEMAVITGLDVVDRHTKVDKKVNEDEVKLFCCKYFGKKEEITRSEIENIIQNLNSVENLDDFRRLSLLYFLVAFLIPNKERIINIEYVYMVYDIGEFNNIAWGKIVYDELLKGLKNCSKKYKTYKKHSHLNGCAYALQVWALERIPILAPPSLQLRIPRYRRYSAHLPLKKEMYECALRSADATVEIKVTAEESRITVIRKALNARVLENNTLHLLVKRVRTLEEEVQFLKSSYAKLKQSKKENPVVFGSKGKDEHTKISKEILLKGPRINTRMTPLTESVREHRKELSNSEPKGNSPRQGKEREANNTEVENDIIDLASDAAEVPIDIPQPQYQP